MKLVTVESPTSKKQRRRHGIITRMYIHRGMYVALSLAVCGLIYGGAYFLYQYNLDNPKTIANFLQTYRIRYDYDRYVGESKFTATRHAIFSSRVPTTEATGYATSVPVLLYHRVAADKDIYNVTPAAFQAQMFALKKAGYSTISADDYAAFVDGTKKLPAKSIFITFDDGTKDSYYPVDPILKALDFRATEFVITKYSIEDYAGSHYYLSAIELKAMERSGHWDLEPHTKAGHSYYAVNSKGDKGEFYPNKLWLPDKQRLEMDAEYAARVYDDMAAAKQEVENFTHKPADLFAFPFADIGENHSSNYAAAPAILTRDASRLFKATMQLYYPGRDHSQEYYNSKQFYAYRIQLTYGQWPDGKGLLGFLRQGSAKSLPYTDNFAGGSGWQNAWGEGSVQGSALTISSTPSDSTGAGVVLDGSSGWSNYALSAQTTLTQGSSYALLARMQGAAYRVGCYFGTHDFSITRSVNGTSTALKEGDLRLPILGHQQTVGIAVSGHTIRCYAGGKLIAQASDPTIPPSGSIGFSVYDPKHASSLAIQGVKVTAL